MTTDLQSVPFGRLGIPPAKSRRFKGLTRFLSSTQTELRQILASAFSLTQGSGAAKAARPQRSVRVSKLEHVP